MQTGQATVKKWVRSRQPHQPINAAHVKKSTIWQYRYCMLSACALFHVSEESTYAESYFLPLFPGITPLDFCYEFLCSLVMQYINLSPASLRIEVTFLPLFGNVSNGDNRPELYLQNAPAELHFFVIIPLVYLVEDISMNNMGHP